MNNIKNWAIAILGIVCIALVWQNKSQKNEINALNNTIIAANAALHSANVLLDETCDYVEERYEDYLPDTLWEGDAYDEYMFNYITYKGL